MDCVSLDVAQIVGPSYAVLALTPELGPLSGGRELIVQGINFVVDSKAQVKFTNGVDEEVVDGVVLSSTEIQCTTASFEKFGAQQAEVKVSIGTEMFTVNRVHYTFYDDTHAPNCVAFGTGLLGCMAGKPAQFLLQAKDTKNLPRTSGTDDFHIELRRTIKGKVDKFGGSVVDHDTGLYSLKYIAPMPGSFSLAVTLNGSHIRGSPFATESLSTPDAVPSLISQRDVPDTTVVALDHSPVTMLLTSLISPPSWVTKLA
jgi:dynein heavy chain